MSWNTIQRYLEDFGEDCQGKSKNPRKLENSLISLEYTIQFKNVLRI